jgi:hypothetical protein
MIVGRPNDPMDALRGQWSVRNPDYPTVVKPTVGTRFPDTVLRARRDSSNLHDAKVKQPVIYLIGALKNLEIPKVGKALRDLGFDVFDEWWSASPDADEWWQEHERFKGKTYKEAINGYHANCVFNFDKQHLDRSDIGVLVMPAGRSGHIELGYLVGKGKAGYILFDGEPERFDVMYRFANDVCFSLEELKSVLITNHLQNR